MNKLMQEHKRKLSPESSIITAINGIADELYELRKENRDLQGELKNIAGSLDYVSQYLYDISWELKKNREKSVDREVQHAAKTFFDLGSSHAFVNSANVKKSKSCAPSPSAAGLHICSTLVTPANKSTADIVLMFSQKVMHFME